MSADPKNIKFVQITFHLSGGRNFEIFADENPSVVVGRDKIAYSYSARGVSDKKGILLLQQILGKLSNSYPDKTKHDIVVLADGAALEPD